MLYKIENPSASAVSEMFCVHCSWKDEFEMTHFASSGTLVSAYSLQYDVGKSN